ncbi:hypothetical protein Pint_25966 [Pistacia integerrima]|uniref:Uncharacterized protein n=1 Tax=Pistacia integerrima TaxID=434235 RepID=A0ACC0YC69_9ROSI|nr:hypothetical protein Pint_25966 [Pistacia integerrima]
MSLRPFLYSNLILLFFLKQKFVMSLQVSAVPTSIKVAKQDTNRRSANFHPSIWGDHFLSYASNSVEAADEKKLQDLREEIKRILKANVNKPAEKLDLVDRIQRLGVPTIFKLTLIKS